MKHAGTKRFAFFRRAASILLAAALALTTTAGLTGTPVLADSGQFTVQTNGTTGLTVTLTNQDDSTDTATQTTDDTGAASFSSSEVSSLNTYTLSVSGVGFETYTEDNVVPDFTSSKTVSLVPVQKVTVGGKVSGSDGKPYPNATVSVSGYSGASTTTDSGGSYSLEIYSGQDYTLTVTPADTTKYQTFSQDLNVTKDKTLDVPLALKQYHVAAGVTLDGDAAPDGACTVTGTGLYDYGTTPTVQIQAADGYVLDSVTVNSEPQTLAQWQTQEDVSTTVKGDVDVEVTLARAVTLTVSLTEDGQGSFSAQQNEKSVAFDGGTAQIKEGTNVAVDIQADTAQHMHISSLNVDGQPVQLLDTDDGSLIIRNTSAGAPTELTYTIASPGKNIQIQAVFAVDTYAVAVSAGKNGTVSYRPFGSTQDTTIGGAAEGSGADTVAAAQNAVLTIQPQEGCRIDSIKVDGSQVAVNDSRLALQNGLYRFTFTLSDILDNHEVDVAFLPVAQAGQTLDTGSLDQTGTVMLATDAQFLKGKREEDGKQVYLFASGTSAVNLKTAGSLLFVSGSGTAGTLAATNQTLGSVTVYDPGAATFADAVRQLPFSEPAVFLIDDTKPTVQSVTVTPSGWTNQDVTVAVSATDTAGSGEPGASGVVAVDYKPSAAGDSAWASAVFDDDDGTYTFDVSQEYDGTYSVRAWDLSGNVSDVTEKTVRIDKTQPAVTGFSFSTAQQTTLEKVLNFLTFGMYSNTDVRVTVAANDPQSSGMRSGVASIRLYTDAGHTAAVQPDADSFQYDDQTGNATQTFTLTAAQADIPAVISHLSASTTDTAGNTSAVIKPSETPGGAAGNDTLTQDATAPSADVTVPAGDSSGTWHNSADDAWWYDSTDIRFDITAQDAGSGVASVQDWKVNGQPVAASLDSAVGTDGQTPVDDFTAAAVSKAVYHVNLKDAAGAQEGANTLTATVTDNAGNVTDISKTVYVDTTAPSITGVSFQPLGSQDGDGSQFQKQEYGFYFQQATQVTVTASDPAPASGVRSISYYTVDYSNSAQGETSPATTKDVDGNGQITFTLPADFKGQIYLKATDKVDNAPSGTNDGFVTPDGCIVERPQSHAAAEHIALAYPDTAYTDNNGLPLYSADVNVGVTVTESYAGVRTVEWKVTAPYDTAGNQSGTLTVDNGSGFAQGSDAGWSVSQRDHNLVTRLNKTITLSNNSNSIQLWVRVTDRAGNVSENTRTVSIDKTAPEISIRYDNNSFDQTFASQTQYFKADRTATVTIRERNFRASDVTSSIQASAGTPPAISGWATQEDAADPDQTTHTATVHFHADADYLFDIAYHDNAGNAAPAVAQQKFTIDETAPVIHVDYNGNTAQNGDYYAAERTATITIIEHNFETGRVRVTGTASDGASPAAFPATGGWSDNGDVHTAQIHYQNDGLYTFSISYTDKAGNDAAPFAQQQFYIDKTKPAMSITGVADQSANKGDVAPVVSVSDQNFDASTLSISLTGANRGALTPDGAYQDAANGRTFTFADFPKEQDVDDLYTLTASVTDKAGNVSTQTIQFSVNRFGSVYTLSDQTKRFNNTYIKQAMDVVITETNVDTLDLSTDRVTVTKNSTPEDLKPGSGYDVAAAGGAGQWKQYTYTIGKDNFKSDGKYTVMLVSQDAAGNTNQSSSASKNASISFGVDKTPPVITSVNVASDTTYPVDQRACVLSAADNLVLSDMKVYLNGQEVDCQHDNDDYTFSVQASNTPYTIKAVATDAAGNTTTKEIAGMYVTTNLFVRWYTSKAAFAGTWAGLAAVGALCVFLLFRRRGKPQA